jgi:hypothetical protein
MIRHSFKLYLWKPLAIPLHIKRFIQMVKPRKKIIKKPDAYIREEAIIKPSEI